MNTILVVDDNEEILELTKILLEREDYKLILAKNGDEALQSVNKYEVDLILLDAVIPSINGLDVCRILKKGNKTKNIPVIMFSTFGEGVKTMFDDELQPDDYLGKPFSKHILLKKIRTFL